MFPVHCTEFYIYLCSLFSVLSFIYIYINIYKTQYSEQGTYSELWNIYISGLEKLTNANRSVSSVNDRLFPVELTEIADWKSMSEYMLRSNFGKP